MRIYISHKNIYNENIYFTQKEMPQEKTMPFKVGKK